MGTTFIETSERYGYDFITAPYIPEGKDEYYLRNEQTVQRTWRHLTEEEIRLLENERNICPCWNNILVTDPFNPHVIRDSSFYGLVRLGSLGNGLLRFHDYTVPEGITASRIVSCDIGNHCAIHDCAYLSHYIIGDTVILSSVREMDTTNHAKFGSGIIKDGETEEVRIWLSPLNEAGGRDILPFEELTCADAWLWTIYRDDTELTGAFKRITQNSLSSRRGWYGTVGSGAVIKHCLTIKDVKIGEAAYIKGANKLKNLTIKSDEKEPAQIGEGVELVNGIIGYGCRIFYGCKAVRFVMGNNSSLKYGARLIHSILGDNSTVSCCEVLNTLVFPGHEQHHNNSFLIAAVIMGQSNMAAGATVGSNHNSRGNDGEIIAGRGFWPGLSSTLKHNCRFASFTLLTKGNYPHELCIPLPFSMLIESTADNRLEVMPAYWWMYNMYALERNSRKYRDRDTRQHIVQYIETDYLAPDTAQEITEAQKLLELWTGTAFYKSRGFKEEENTPEKLRETGKRLLLEKQEMAETLFICGENIERSRRPVKIIKAVQAYRAYSEMLLYYGIRTLVYYFDTCGGNIADFQKEHPGAQSLNWVNLGGQPVPEYRADNLRAAVRSGKYTSWQDIHAEYERFRLGYPLDKALNALQCLKNTAGDSSITAEQWNTLLGKAGDIRKYIAEQVYRTKRKDYDNRFRDSTCRNKNERDAVLGCVEDNPFIQTSQKETADFLALLDKSRI